MKKKLALLLTCSMVLGLTACGGFHGSFRSDRGSRQGRG